MKAAIKKPGLDWEHVDIEPTLKNLQEIVGGYI